MVSPGIELYLAPSQLNSTFTPNRDIGTFTKNPIKAGSIVYKQPDFGESKLNDSMINLTPLFEAKTNNEIYLAWKNLASSYYDVEKMKERINIRLVYDSNRKVYYRAIKDIPANTELTRMYGFTTWILELPELMTEKKLAGFAQFVFDLEKSETNDPYHSRIRRLAYIFRDMLSNFMIDESHVDFEKYEKETITDKKVGTDILNHFYSIRLRDEN